MRELLKQFYLDYVNEYLTINKYAIDNGLEYDTCKQLVELGKRYYIDDLLELGLSDNNIVM